MAVVDKAQLQQLLKGKTPEQQKVIKYFNVAGGCGGSKRTPESEFDEVVKNKLNSLDTKKRALQKIGLDEDELKEIPPVFFQNFQVLRNLVVLQQFAGFHVLHNIRPDFRQQERENRGIFL